MGTYVTTSVKLCCGQKEDIKLDKKFVNLNAIEEVKETCTSFQKQNDDESN